MKKLFKFLWEELVIDPIRGAYNIWQILMKKQDPPEWLTSKWDFKEIFKQAWMLWLLCTFCFVAGWYSASQMHNQQVISLAEELACEIYLKQDMATSYICNTNLIKKNQTPSFELNINTRTNNTIVHQSLS